MAGTLYACHSSFCQTQKSDGLFQSLISISPCELKAVQPAFVIYGNSFPGFCRPGNEAIRSYRGGIPEAPMITNVYQKAVLVTLEHGYYFSTRALRPLKESVVLSPLHHCLLYPRTVFRIDAPKQTSGPQRLCSLQDI